MKRLITGVTRIRFSQLKWTLGPKPFTWHAHNQCQRATIDHPEMKSNREMNRDTRTEEEEGFAGGWVRPCSGGNMATQITHSLSCGTGRLIWPNCSLICSDVSRAPGKAQVTSKKEPEHSLLRQKCEAWVSVETCKRVFKKRNIKVLKEGLL